MTISVGDKIPDIKVMTCNGDGPVQTTTHEMLGAGKVALFSLPGAFTPTCSAKHLPGFVAQGDAFKAKGVTRIVCMSVNDAFVMKAWGEQQGSDGSVEMLADGNGDFARALGLTMDGSGFGMGERAQRFSAVIEEGIVKQLNIEEPGAFEVSGADYMLERL